MVYPQRQQQLQKFVQRLGIAVEAKIDWHLLDLALTHPTVSTTANYEQLEFVGDAVVRLAAAELLYEHYSELPVGEFAAIRSILVSDRVLATVADNYGLERYLLLSPSALNDKSGYQSRMAQALEAVVAALYLPSRTLALVRPWLDSHFQAMAATVLADPARQNYKAALQEWSQGLYKTLPEYQVTEIAGGLDAHQRFHAQVQVNGKVIGEGTGRSRKAAEQAAARVAFFTINPHVN
ncbi:MAG: ribonuclease III [Cyanobacteria bacterium]|nr:ribonuclease III [Cyanobacteriota bacterium]MDW8201960.1 ribonuclease III [Cyanobacteriota bacterium SKYGB_h_bin112]